MKKKIIFSSFLITLCCASFMFGSGSPTGSTSYYGTHTYNNTASLHTTATSPTLDSPLETIDITQGIGAIDIDVNASLQIQTGFEQWLGSGAYFDASTLGSFTVLRAGTGYINTTPIGYVNGVAVGWTAPQTVTGLTAGNTYYIYIDSNGTLQKTTTDSSSLRTNNIVLFEVLRDSTSPTNNQITVKENTSFRMPVATYEYLNDNVGPVIQNDNDGANIVLNGTQKIQINGADVLDDSGLLTTIPDSAGVGVTWRQMFTNALGKWATSTVSDTFTGQWNNLGTVTSLSAGNFAVYTLYAGKDNLNTTTPQYFAVLNVTQYASQAAATAAISAGTISKATLELEALDIAQLGYIIYQQATSSIVAVQIQKATLKSSTSSGGTNNASLVIVDTSLFDGILSAADTNVQAALDTIDEWGKNATNHGVLIGRGVNTPIAAVASVSPSGIPLVSQGAGVDPAYSTAVVAGGGTGVTTMTTAYAPVCAGTTATGALQVASTGLATSGFVLTSNGAAAVPSFQDVAASGALKTLTGDTGGAISPTAGNINLLGSHGINTSGAGSTITTAVNNTLTLGDLSAVATGSPSLTLTTGDLNVTSGNINLPTTAAAGADGVINVNSIRFVHSFGTNNSFVGSGAGNYTLSGTESTALGTGALALMSSGSNNTAIGSGAGATLTTTGNNTAVGTSALAAASGADCTAVGYNALLVNTGASNTAVGSGALDANTTGTPNTAIGLNALGANISGNNNTAVGASAGLAVLTGNNTAVGTSALAAASGADSTAVGYNALLVNTGASNTAVGSGALDANTTGTPNTAIGLNALGANISGNNNTAVGASAGLAVLTGNNTAIGTSALAAASGTNSTAVGYNALLVNTGASNTAVGSGALDANTTGTPNTAVGLNALGANISGNNNTAVGASAGLAVLTGNNTAVGTSALAGASGSDCTAVGYNALLVNQAGSNTAVGSGALDANTTGNSNTAVGVNALGANITGNQNVALGIRTLSVATGSLNTALGYEALTANTASQNTAVGANALDANVAGTPNTAVGFNALGANVSGNNNVAVGANAGLAVLTNQNTAVGSSALAAASGTNSTAVGYQALLVNTGASNTAVGSGALDANTSGTPNTAVGLNALGTNISGNNNTAVGASAGATLITGNNTAVGTSALAAASGADSTAVGYNALLVNTGAQNTSVGSGALDANTTGTPNTAVGFNALGTNITGSNLVAVGANALRDSTGNQNTAVGSNAGLVTTGTDNVYLGYNAGSTATTGSNNIFIGSGVEPLVAVTDTATTIIGNASTAAAYLRGVYGVAPATSGTVMLIDSASKLGAVTSQGTSGQVLTSNGAGALPTWADNVIQTATVTLTAAQVNALNATPIQIIAAPAAGRMIYVINAALRLTHVTTAFSAGGTIDLIYSGLSSDPIITGLGSNAFVTVGSNRVMGGVSGGQVSVAATSVEAVAVQVSNPGAAFTGGGTSTIKVMVNYVVLATT